MKVFSRLVADDDALGKIQSPCACEEQRHSLPYACRGHEGASLRAHRRGRRGTIFSSSPDDSLKARQGMQWPRAGSIRVAAEACAEVAWHPLVQGDVRSGLHWGMAVDTSTKGVCDTGNVSCEDEKLEGDGS